MESQPHSREIPLGDPAENRSDPTLTTLDRGLRILEQLADDGARSGLTLTELARALDMHRSTMFRFLVTLRTRGYIDREPATDRYRLGARTLTLAGAYLDRLDVRRVAHPALQSLCDRTRELVHLVILDQGEAVTIERIEGNNPVSLQTSVGARRPAYCTASGKAMLAYLPADKVDRLLPATMHAYSPTTITSPARMHEHLTEVRRLGYAIDNEERIEGLRCAAAPVFGFDGTVLGAVSIAMPIQRASLERIHQVGQDVRATAAGISRQLGYPGPYANADAHQELRPPGGQHRP
jgi:DNA-binding IclR family transcriptional regulator